MNPADAVERLGVLEPEDRAWILAALSTQARDELLRQMRGAVTGDEPRARILDPLPAGEPPASSHEPAAMSRSVEKLCNLPLGTLVEVLASEPIWLTAALLRAADWPWRAQLLQRLPHVALYLSPTVESSALTDTLASSLLRRIADKAASMPPPVAATKFELLVQRIAARRAAALRSI